MGLALAITCIPVIFLMLFGEEEPAPDEKYPPGYNTGIDFDEDVEVGGSGKVLRFKSRRVRRRR